MSIDTLLGELWEEVKHFGEDEKQALILAIKDGANQYRPTVAAAAKDAILVVKDSMFEASGPEKSKAATDLIVSNLESQGIRVGIDVGLSFVMRTLENVYELLKAVWEDIQTEIIPGVPGKDGQPIYG
jgi:hypothetical protein